MKMLNVIKFINFFVIFGSKNIIKASVQVGTENLSFYNNKSDHWTKLNGFCLSTLPEWIKAYANQVAYCILYIFVNFAYLFYLVLLGRIYVSSSTKSC